VPYARILVIMVIVVLMLLTTLVYPLLAHGARRALAHRTCK